MMVLKINITWKIIKIYMTDILQSRLGRYEEIVPRALQYIWLANVIKCSLEYMKDLRKKKKTLQSTLQYIFKRRYSKSKSIAMII